MSVKNKVVKHKVNARHAPFVTQMGVPIFTVPFSPMLIQDVVEGYSEQRPTPPSYEVESLGGIKAHIAHTPETLSTPEEKALYQQYLADYAMWESKQTRAMLTVICMEGVPVEENEEVLDLAYNKLDRFAKYGLPIPYKAKTINPRKIAENKAAGIDENEPVIDESALLHQFIVSFALSGPDEFIQFMTHALKVAGIDQERLQKAEKMFRTDVQGEGDNVG